MRGYGKHVLIGRPRCLDLDREIARLEHSTATVMIGPPIAPLGVDPEHCQRCACVAAGHRTVTTELITDGRWEHSWGPRCGECNADLRGLA